METQDRVILALDNFQENNDYKQLVPNGIDKNIWNDWCEKNKTMVRPAHPGSLLDFPVSYLKLIGSKFNNFKDFKIEFCSSENIPKNTRYFYPIRVFRPDFFNVKECGYIKADSFYKDKPLSISKNIIEDARNNICKIVFLYDFEGQGNWAHREYFFECQAKLLNLSVDSFIYIDGNKICRQIYKDVGINAYYYNTWEYVLPTFHEAEIDTIITEIKNKKSRPKKFINFNRKPHFHRILLTDKIIKHNLENEMLLTLGDFDINSLPVMKDPHYDTIKHRFNFELLKTKTPITHDFKDLKNTNPLHINREAQFSAYINITSETYAMSSLLRVQAPGHIFFSEKTFKPIVCLQPFLQVNFFNSLKHLRELGYKTFHPFINEDYDNVMDDFERIDTLFNEILRLSKLSDNEIKELMINLLPILEHNLHTYVNNMKENAGGRKVFQQILKEW